ncbi:hypothetical protein KP509_06G000100 [Ceratopteris richardii]|uniref:Uncharacterized protein n=1 Tax=Ceratopteris richardii TaxID=49495 RepID=A0A8T2UF60_CERRI|nr:hypothetical protein KP509_06G000100 [Ceratopteris richardii]
MDSYTLQGQMNSLLSMWPQHSLTHKSCGPFLSCRPYIYDGSFTKATKSSSLRACGNSSNGSAFAPLPNSDSDSNKNHNKGTFNRQARPGQNVQKTPDEATQKGKTSPVSKQIIESNIEKSRGSLEGIQQQQQDHIEQGQDGSLISYEGTTHKDSGVAKSSKNAGDQKEVSTSVSESDSFWRSVFPAYMRSKEEEEHLSVPGDESSHENAKGLGVRGAAAARAAAAAAASAKELESHVNLQTASTLSSSSLSSSTYDRPIKGKKLEELMSDDPIWAAIRAEARLEPSNMHRMCYGVYFSKKSPSLKPPGWGSILAHPCFERSLGFVLANRLKDTTC